ncbi:MAG: YeeE/YedE family protein [Agarilytica sp.]
MKHYVNCRSTAALVTGGLFGAGLALSGMSDRNKVIGFLDIFGAWDPSLMFVMGAALVLSVPGFYLVLKRHHPFLADKFFLPTSNVIDKPLIVGAALFGLGWGLYGYCPGPAVVSLVYLNLSSVVFVAAMLAGIVLAKFIKIK